GHCTMQSKESAVPHQPRYALFTGKDSLQDAFLGSADGKRLEETRPGRWPRLLLPCRPARQAAVRRRRIHAAIGPAARDTPARARRSGGLFENVEEPESGPDLWRSTGRRQAFAS